MRLLVGEIIILVCATFGCEHQHQRQLPVPIVTNPSSPPIIVNTPAQIIHVPVDPPAQLPHHHHHQYQYPGSPSSRPIIVR